MQGDWALAKIGIQNLAKYSETFERKINTWNINLPSKSFGNGAFDAEAVLVLRAVFSKHTANPEMLYEPHHDKKKHRQSRKNNIFTPKHDISRLSYTVV